MQKVLFPTDFSNNAYNALFYATQLLKSEKCTFYILNTYDEHTPLHNHTIPKEKKMPLIKQLAEESDFNLEHTLHRITLDTGKNPLHTFKTISKNKDLVATIIKTVASENIDLVVMGNKGTTGAKEIFFGSNTVKTIKAIKECPVLGVPNEIDYRVPKKIAFVTDYKKPYDPKMVDSILFLASLHGSSIQLMHIEKEKKRSPDQETNKKSLQKMLANVSCTENKIPLVKNKAHTIDLYTSQWKIDLLVMVYRQHNILEKLMREPVIKDISFYLNIPFLIIPHKD